MNDMTDEELIKMTDIHLVQSFEDALCDEMPFGYTDSMKAELYSRLTKGRKAIEAMEKINKIEINHKDYSEYVDAVRDVCIKWEAV